MTSPQKVKPMDSEYGDVYGALHMVCSISLQFCLLKKKLTLNLIRLYFYLLGFVVSPAPLLFCPLPRHRFSFVVYRS